MSYVESPPIYGNTYTASVAIMNESPTTLSGTAGALENLAMAASRLAETAGALHAARQRHENAAADYKAAQDRLAAAREGENL